MAEPTTNIDNKLILSSVRALWGMVPSSLRSVSVELQDETIIWQCLFDATATENDIALLSEAATEVIADFNDFTMKEVLEIVPNPQKLIHLKNIIYLRHEMNSDQD